MSDHVMPGHLDAESFDRSEDQHPGTPPPQPSTANSHAWGLWIERKAEPKTPEHLCQKALITSLTYACRFTIASSAPPREVN